MKFFTKKTMLVLSIIFLLIPISAIILQETCNMDNGQSCKENWSLIGEIGKTTFWPAVIFFITSSATYPFKANVFETWKRFAVWATPLTVILTYIILNMESSSGGWIGPSFHPGMILLPLLYGAFTLISLTIILVTAIKYRK